ncbi:hypothetical protein [Myceligenerans xiligouense]|uniref:Uncharacterized protein n=1 Tax=Myceligenerans xiligouense TaxID=253184 RepID=A0A3N4YQP5_9MICO|nr:hypothetical protein [Myceligenerans xiligouense]RPF23359.1 hypothetical protein EDD34_4044 [Myceligenerans xiligouense]
MHSRYRALLVVVTVLAVSLMTVGVIRGMHERAPTGAEDATVREDPRGAVVRLVDEGEAVRTALGELIAEGRDIAGTDGNADLGASQALNEALSTAEAHHAAPVPEVPGPAATTEAIAAAHVEAEDWVGDLRWMAAELARNISEYERPPEERRPRAGLESPHPEGAG